MKSYALHAEEAERLWPVPVPVPVPVLMLMLTKECVSCAFEISLSEGVRFER